jgi:hypothetical protein
LGSEVLGKKKKKKKEKRKGASRSLVLDEAKEPSLKQPTTETVPDPGSSSKKGI